MDREFNKKVASAVREYGYEVTPEQVQEIREGALAKLRDALAEKGIELPEEEREAILFLYEAMQREEGRQ